MEDEEAVDPRLVFPVDSFLCSEPPPQVVTDDLRCFSREAADPRRLGCVVVVVVFISTIIVFGVSITRRKEGLLPPPPPLC